MIERHDSIDHGQAAGTAQNAVLEQQRRLTAEFTPLTGSATTDANVTGPFEHLLCEILTSVGWHGGQNRIFEALPHFEPIRSFKMLRTVLARLDVSLIPVERPAGGLSAADLPCLVTDDDHCRLVIPGPNGTFVLRNPHATEWSEADARPDGTDAGTRSQAGDRLHAWRSWPKAAARLLQRSVRQERPPVSIYLIRPQASEESPDRSKPFGGFVGHVLSRLRTPVLRISWYSAAINALDLLLSLYVLLVYDIVIATSSLDTMAYLAAAGLAVLAVELRLRQARSRTIAYVASRFDGVVSVRALACVLHLPLSLIERAPLAAQIARLRQMEIGRELFAGTFASALFDLPFTLMFTFVLFIIGGVLGFVPIGLALVIVALSLLTATVSLTKTADVGAARLKADERMFELADKLRTIRNAAAEHICLTRYAESLAVYQRARFSAVQLGAGLHAVNNALVALAGVITLSIGALRVVDGAMSLGELIAAMLIVWRILVPIQVVSLNLARLKQTLSTAHQINEVVRLGSEHERATAPALFRRLGGDITVSGVYLSFLPQHEPQLRGVNLAVPAGEIVAITGPSGSGKSTLLKVLLGLYPQFGGTVRLGGLDLRQLDPAEVRAAIGYASQQPAFFYGSVAANFRFACPDATDAQILDALGCVGVTLPEPDLPDGLATRISGNRTRSLSRGWLGRLSVARALVKAPAILLLDEPGSDLDPAGDAIFMRHLESIRGRCTVLLVTARPSHMRIADRIVEMRSGVVVAEGKPDAMLPRILKQIKPSAA